MREAFPSFPQLPPELQDMIWRLAIRNTIPEAHDAQLHRVSGFRSPIPSQPGRRMALRMLHELFLHRSTQKKKSSTHALAQACRRSHRAVMRHQQKRVVGNPFQLAESRSSGTTVGTPLPACEIDSETDLVILQPGWASQAKRVSEINDYQTRGMQHATPQLTHLAVKWDPESEDWADGALNALSGLLDAFYESHLFFIIVPPSDARQLMTEQVAFHQGLRKYVAADEDSAPAQVTELLEQLRQRQPTREKWKRHRQQTCGDYLEWQDRQEFRVMTWNEREPTAVANLPSPPDL